MENKMQPKLRFPEFSGEWENNVLGKLVNFLDGKRKPLKDSDRASIKGVYPYYGASGIIDYINDYIFDEELILLGEDGANIVTRNSRLAFLAYGKYWVNNHAHVMKAKKMHNQYFICEYLESLNYEKYNTGTAQPKLNKEICSKIVVTYPSLPEQQKIASFLSSVDSKIEKLENKKALLDEYKRGVMQKIFSHEIRFRGEDGKEYPDWVEKKLGEIGKIITGKTPPTKDIDLWNGEIDFITPTDIDESIKYLKGTNRTVKNGKFTILPKGTIIYTCIASIGKMCLSTKEAITNQQINSIIPFKDNNEFIYYSCLNLTPKIKATQANTTLPIINKTEFSKFKIELPCLEEQEKIANFLSGIDKKIEFVKQETEQVKEFKRGLLQQMFV